MKHNWKKSTLAFLLTLLMVTGLFAALGASAWAYDSPYASLAGTTTTVSFNNIDWYVIKDESTAVNEGTVTLLAKKPIGSSTFHDGGASQDSKFMAYDISTVKEYLDRQTAEGGGFARVAYAIAPTDLDDVSVTGAKLYLLSDTEANALKNINIKKTTMASGADNNYWWLRTPQSTGYYYPAAAKRVDGNGYAGYSSNVGSRLGVRPALRLDLSKVTYNTTSRRFVVAPLEYSVTLSGGANATADPATGTSQTGLTGAMTTVTYTANSGYMFPETSDYYTTTSGVTVARTSNTKVTVSGAPTANVTITVPDAVVDDTGAPVPYLAWDYTNKTMVEKTGDEACTGYIEVTDSTTTWGEPDSVSWYVVKKNVTISSRITVSGNVSLILCNGAKLTASKGISVADGGNILNIYAQSTDKATMGELIATGRPHNSYSGTEFADAGIGGTEGSAGIITINGGKITATGGYYYTPGGGAGIGGGRKGNGGTITINGGIINANGMEGGAGIGGGTRTSDSGGDGGIITINGGVVVAKVIGTNPRGAGIGGGDGGSGGIITINGGRVTTTGGTWSAGIGGGAIGNGGQITINDGNVEATGGAGGAGIGGGGSSGSGGIININGGTVEAFGKMTPSSDNKASGAGIGGGNEGDGGIITISGGTVTAAADGGGAGIGGGSSSNGGTITIENGSITATGGRGAAAIGGGVYGAGANVTITGGSVKAYSGGTNAPGYDIPPAVAIGRGMKNWVGMELSDNQLNVGQGLYVYGGETEATKAYIVLDVQGDYTRTQYMEVNDTVPPGYTITVDSSVTHGSVTPSATVAPEGTAIALTVAPETDYMLDVLSANYVNGTETTPVSLTKTEDGKYTFTMPAGNVTVNAKFSKPTITGADLALNGSLDFRFYVDIPAGIDTTGANMSFSIGGGNRRTIENIPLTSAGISTDTATNGQRIFSFPVYAIEMAEDVTAVFHYKEGGEDKTATLTTSIKKYLDKVEELNKDSNYSEKLAKLITATRNYGHYMQPYLASLHGFTIGTDYTAMPAGSEITALESLTGFERTGNTSDSLPTGYDNSVLNAVGYYDTFSESTTLNVLVNLKTSPTTVTATVDGKEATVENPSDNIYRIQISNIAANNLGTPYRVVFSADNAVFCDMNVSAMTYVGTVLPKAAERNQPGEAEALTAFYDYYVAAKAYAGN